MVSLRQLEYLVALGEMKSFSRAAEKCHISQPTLSVQIQNLEEALGVQLIERRKKDLLLTPIGTTVYHQAKQALRIVGHIHELCAESKTPLTGRLVLGVIPTIAPYFLPHILPIIQHDYPKLEVFLLEEKTDRLLQMLEEGAVDLCLIALPAGDGQSFKSVDIFSEPFVAALPANHVLTSQKQVSLDDIQDGELLLLEEGHCLRDHALDACHVAPRMIKGASFKATSLETLKHMVSAGRGVTLLPQTAIDKHKSYTVRPLSVQGAHRKIGLAWRRSSLRGAEFYDLAKSISKASDSLAVTSILK